MGCTRVPKLVQREGQQPQEGGPAGEGLVDPIRQQELPAAGQHEEAVPAVLVGEHLQPGEQRRDALDLVENHAARPRRDEPLRVLLGELPVVRRFQIDVGEVGQGRPAERRLARLPRAGDRDERVPAEQILEERRNRAGDHDVMLGESVLN